MRRGETPGFAWVMASAQRIWGARGVQQASEISAIGGPLVQDSPRGLTRQQVIAMVSCPRPGRGALAQRLRALLQHPHEEPVT
eukprot:11160044-Alexandrium_andersonii.AAC.1